MPHAMHRRQQRPPGSRLGLVPVLLRSGVLVRQALVALLCVTLASLLVHAAAAMSPSRAQLAQRELGPFEHVVGLERAGDPTAFLTSPAVMRRAGATSALVVVDYAFAFARLSTDNRRVLVREGAWGQRPDMPGSVRLLDGRWPAAPGEAVATSDLSQPAYDDYGGRIHLTIVGHVRDFDVPHSGFLLAPGTGASWHWNELTDAGVQPLISVYWTGLSREAGVRALEESYGPSLRLGTVTDRADILRGSAVAPTAVWGLWVPAGLACLIGGALFGLLSRRWLARISELARRTGIRHRPLRRQLIVADLSVVAVASVCGVLCGFLLSVAARPALAALSVRRLSEVQLWWLLLPVAVGGGVVGCLLGYSAGGVRPMRAARRESRRAVVLSCLLRWAGAAGLGWRLATTSRLELRLTSGRLAFLCMGALAGALLSPELFSLLRRLRPRQLQASLAARVTARFAGRMALLVIAASLMSGIALGYGALRLGQLAAWNDRPAWVQPGQLWLDSSAFTRDPDEVRRGIENRAHLADPVPWSWTGWGVPSRGPIWSVPDVTALERVLGKPLSAADRQLVAEGAVVRAVPQATTTQRVQLRPVGSAAGSGPEVSLVSVPVEQPTLLLINHSFVVGSALPVPPTRADGSAHRGMLLYTGATDAQRDAAYAALDEMVVNRLVLTSHVDPPPGGLSAADLIAIAVTALLAGAVTGSAVAATGRALRPYASSLRAIGLPARWARRVVDWSSAWTLVTVLTVATASMGASMWGMARIRGAQNAFLPWGLVGLFAATVVLSSLFISRLATARLHARERMHDL